MSVSGPFLGLLAIEGVPTNNLRQPPSYAGSKTTEIRSLDGVR